MHILILVAFFATAHARAVNISNTWVLPEEGFPVFYRYFRDRISWYEADAVCQFHHANLVTVDTTAQYDAVRAYLKELDITSAVWVGLIRSNPEGDFTWTDYRGLSGDGYWSSIPDPRTAPLCAAADPIADYRWEARACGGPTVASFICELPVPQWALGSEGCMVRALPALTILYLPESAAVQLTADCGLAGVKRLQCTGNVKREDLLRDLTCAEEVEISSPSNNISMTNSTITDVSTVTENQDSPIVIITEENLTIEHESNDYLSPNMMSTPFQSDENVRRFTISELQSTEQPIFNEINKILIEKNINFDVMHNNNLQSNDIPNLVNNDNFLTNYRIQKMEDEDNMQHKKLHDELARLGNFETIFTQPTDHFVPPLVIAKAKLSDDMTVLSLEEKHAQHLGAHNMLKHSNEENRVLNVNPKSIVLTEQPIGINNLVGSSSEQTITLKDDVKRDNIKNALPKKYVYKGFDTKSPNISKSKTMKINVIKAIKETANESYSSFKDTNSNLNETNVTLRTTTTHDFDEIQNNAIIDLTVTFRETNDKNDYISKEDNEKDTEFENIFTNKSTTYLELSTIKTELYNGTQFAQNNTPMKSNNIEIAKLIPKVTNSSVGNNSRRYDDVFYFNITTKIPVFKDDLINSSSTNVIFNGNAMNEISSEKIMFFDSTTEHDELSSATVGDLQSTNSNFTLILPFSAMTEASSDAVTENTQMNTKSAMITLGPSNNSKSNESFDQSLLSTLVSNVIEVFNITDNIEEIETKSGDQETIDDFQSPLLSGANEPFQRPNRSRRPKQPLNRINKFNPFRILG